MSPTKMEEVWKAHTDAEFVKRDVAAVLATMVEEPSVINMPLNSGGRGRDQVRAFYRDVFIPSLPDDMQAYLVNRVIGENCLVDEVHHTFTHNKQMDWLLPGVPPTHKRIEWDMVAVIEFWDEKIGAERNYWDHASVLRQAGLLYERKLPIATVAR